MRSKHIEKCHLSGIGVQFYRGIGPRIQYMAPFSRMNFFIGPNNAGKSIVLNLISKHLQNLSQESRIPRPAPIEEYKGEESGHFLLLVGKPREVVLSNVKNKNQPGHSRESYFEAQISTILDNISSEGHVWLEIEQGGAQKLYPKVDPKDAAQWGVSWQALWNKIQGASGGSALQHWIPEVLRFVAAHAATTLGPVYIIPAKRQLGEKGEEFGDLSGKGLIDHLATLQNPSYDKQKEKEKFRQINNFLRDITGKPEAQLEVPSEREHLLVHMDNKVLPLSSLGTGIHEVVLIAAFCTIFDGSIMCIEEPEIHLHPLLQRKLINYLMRNTTSQYFIATHSSVFIDTPESTVFRVANDGSQTYINAVISKDQQRTILDDLGCHASDILQSNAIIWVEGPSDRIYLNHWISEVDDSLLEGVHYTIMFYGGGLLAHLTASDEALTEFINLRHMNRNMAMVIDSDRSGESDPLKPHAQRILSEMKTGGSIVWITEGREVENYIDGAALQAAMKNLHPRIYLAPGATGKYDHAFYFWRDNPKKPGERSTYKEGDKVGAANIICASDADLDILDLRQRVNELVEMILKANGISP